MRTSISVAFAETLRCGEEALATAQSIGYTRATASALQTVAYGAQHCGELDRAAQANDALTELAESLGDKYYMQCAHRTRGVLGMYRAEPSAAEALAAARELAARTHDDLNLAAISCDQGALALALGQDDQARRALEDVLPLADRVQPVYAARNRCLLAEAAVRRADLAEARHWLDRALASPLAELFHTTRAQARLARARGDHHRAWELADGGLESARSSGRGYWSSTSWSCWPWSRLAPGSTSRPCVSWLPPPRNESAWATCASL